MDMLKKMILLVISVILMSYPAGGFRVYAAANETEDDVFDEEDESADLETLIRKAEESGKHTKDGNERDSEKNTGASENETEDVVFDEEIAKDTEDATGNQQEENPGSNAPSTDTGAGSAAGGSGTSEKKESSVNTANASGKDSEQSFKGQDSGPEKENKTENKKEKITQKKTENKKEASSSDKDMSNAESDKNHRESVTEEERKDNGIGTVIILVILAAGVCGGFAAWKKTHPS